MIDRVLISQKKFSMKDQINFARFSGDHNPMHLSESYSVKTPPGQPIVHGIHSLLWALESLLESKNQITRNISVKFISPIYLGETVRCFFISQSNQIIIENQNTLLVKINLTGEVFSDKDILLDEPAHFESSLEIENPTIDDISVNSNFNIVNSVKTEYALKLFPLLSSGIGVSLTSKIANLSYVIGMQVPGLNSIFVSTKIEFISYNSKNLITVKNIDKRFSLVDLELISKNFNANLRAIFRPTPIENQNLSQIKKLPKNKFIKNKNVLVIGGSRGIGKAVVQILSLWGANVTFTFHRCNEDAKILSNMLSSENANVNYLQLDVSNQDFSKLEDLDIDYLFYFATPKIFNKRGTDFDADLYSNFKLFYYSAFKQLMSFSIKKKIKKVFYPSTIAVEEKTKGLEEYIKAKLQGESLIEELNRDSKIKIVLNRLPRTLSDQTTSHLMVDNKDPIDVMMPIIKDFFKES